MLRCSWPRNDQSRLLVVRRKVEGYPESDGAFHRAFERDKEDLREIGIPLVTQEIPGTDPAMLGYQIPQDQYYLPDPGLTADELAALHFATLAVQFGDPDHEALWKLGGVGMSGVPEVETLTSLEADANLVVIFDAILARQVIRFQYNDKERSLESWRLDYQRGRWYVSGFDHSAQAQRNYRLDRIAGAVETVGDPKAYDIPEDPAKGERRVLRPWEIGDGEPVAAELRVTDPPGGVCPAASGRRSGQNSIWRMAAWCSACRSSTPPRSGPLRWNFWTMPRSWALQNSART